MNKLLAIMGAIAIMTIMWAVTCTPPKFTPETNQVAWMQNLAVGKQWTDPPYGSLIVEANTSWVKYRVYDPRDNTPKYAYIIVMNDRILEIWQQ